MSEEFAEKHGKNTKAEGYWMKAGNEGRMMRDEKGLALAVILRYSEGSSLGRKGLLESNEPLRTG